MAPQPLLTSYSLHQPVVSKTVSKILLHCQTTLSCFFRLLAINFTPRRYWNFLDPTAFVCCQLLGTRSTAWAAPV